MQPENLELISDMAMLSTFLGDDEIKLLSKKAEFRRHVVSQKRVLASLLKNSFELLDEERGVARSQVIQASSQPSLYKPSPKVENKWGDESALLKEVTALFAEKTGYPVEMLDPKLDLEADLGIDSVKQIEILGMIRRKFQLELKEDFSLKQTPTLEAIVKMIAKQVSD